MTFTIPFAIKLPASWPDDWRSERIFSPSFIRVSDKTDAEICQIMRSRNLNPYAMWNDLSFVEIP